MLQSNIRVEALILDCEQWCDKKDDPDWIRARTKKYNDIWDIGRKLFPNARIEWFGRGVHRCASKAGAGWCYHPCFTLAEKGEYYSCQLYCLWEIGYMRETFRRTYKLAKEHGVKEVTPWVALGAGNRRKVHKFHEFDKDWDFELIYSWQFGAELNRPAFAKQPERFAPYNAATVVIFYPMPFAPKTPAWGKHFVAYVLGANAKKELPVPPVP